MKCDGNLVPLVTWVHEDNPPTRHHPVVPDGIEVDYEERNEAAVLHLVGRTYSEAGLAPPD